MTVPEISAHVKTSGRETKLEASLVDSGEMFIFFAIAVSTVKIRLIDASASSEFLKFCLH